MSTEMNKILENIKADEVEFGFDLDFDSSDLKDIMPERAEYFNERILAKDYLVSNDDFETGFNNNDLVVGGSGSGKTGGYVIPNIKRCGCNMVVTDTKSQLYKILGHELKKRNYNVRVIDFVNPINSIGYNPLEYIRRERSIDGIYYNNKDIMTLARILIPTVNARDPFWENSARTVIAFLIAFTLEALDESEHNMRSLIRLYGLLKNPAAKKNMAIWCMKYPESFAARKYSLFSDIMNVDRTWECISQHVAEALDPFDFREADHIFGRVNSSYNFKLSELWEGRTILFLNVSDTDRYADKLVSIIYTQALQILCAEADRRNDGRLPEQVRFIMDDFAASTYIEDFDKIISVIRSRNIAVSVIIQSISQLESLYSKSQSNTIITNCDHILFLGSQDIDTANYIGHRCNKTEENILLMPKDKAYLIERGSIGKMVDRVSPYVF